MWPLAKAGFLSSFLLLAACGPALPALHPPEAEAEPTAGDEGAVEGCGGDCPDGEQPQLEPEPEEHERPQLSLRIGAWNVKKLGHGTSKRYDLVARVIEEHFDVVVIVEVMQKQGGHPGYDELMATLGSGWAGVVTSEPRPRTTSGNAEFYAVLWRPTRVRQCEGWSDLRYFSDDDGSPQGSRSAPGLPENRHRLRRTGLCQLFPGHDPWGRPVS